MKKFVDLDKEVYLFYEKMLLKIIFIENDWVERLMLNSFLNYFYDVYCLLKLVFYVKIVIVILLFWIMVIIGVGVVFFGICVVISFIVLFVWFFWNRDLKKKEFIDKYYN